MKTAIIDNNNLNKNNKCILFKQKLEKLEYFDRKVINYFF